MGLGCLQRLPFSNADESAVTGRSHENRGQISCPIGQLIGAGFRRETGKCIPERIGTGMHQCTRPVSPHRVVHGLASQQ